MERGLIRPDRSASKEDAERFRAFRLAKRPAVGTMPLLRRARDSTVSIGRLILKRIFWPTCFLAALAVVLGGRRFGPIA